MKSINLLVNLYRTYLVVEKGVSPNTLDAYMRDLSIFLAPFSSKGNTIEQVDTAAIISHMIALRDQGLGPRSLCKASCVHTQFL
jgi:integrase/recombinase XerD